MIKKLGLVIALMSFILFISGCNDSSSQKEKNVIDENSPDYVYPHDGPDTSHCFGKSCRFVLLRSHIYDETAGEFRGTAWDLYDQKENIAIEEEIRSYHNAVSPYVYTYGKNGFTKLNYETGEFKQSKNITDFPEEDQETIKKVFSSMFI